MPGIFICYRRDESAGHAGRLHEHLRDHFGKKLVFMDVKIQPGKNWVRVIEKRLQTCDVLLAVIGPRWLEVRKDGQRRVDLPNDHLRHELVSSLTRGVRVLPVLAGGAKMPTDEDLPEALVPLAAQQAAELDESHYTIDERRLVGVLEQILVTANPKYARRFGRRPSGPDRPGLWARWRVRILLFLCLIALPSSVLWCVLHDSSPDAPLGLEHLVAIGIVLSLFWAVVYGVVLIIARGMRT